MTAQAFLNGFKNHLLQLSENTQIANWKYIGQVSKSSQSTVKNEIAFRFRKNEVDIRLRSIPIFHTKKSVTSYIVVESYNELFNQISNLDLAKTYKEGQINRLFDNFRMSHTPSKLCQTLMYKNGFTNTDIITEFEDETIDYQKVLMDILNWSEIREKAKIEILNQKEVNSTTLINRPEPMIETVTETITETTEAKTQQLNYILYGPPGTGKTYNTVNYALHFLEGKPLEELLEEKRSELRKRFESYKEKGQIVFTTFHQSFTYEDFVEGIKPNLKGSDISYQIRDGIFKNICSDAKGKRKRPFEDAYEEFKAYLTDEESIDLETPSRKKKFKVFLNSNGNPVAKPYTNTGTEMTITQDMIKTYIDSGKIRDWKPYLVPISEYFKENYWQQEEATATNQNYVLIIDEINRGNVSQIFGELITLIETDKRQEGKEPTSVKLPYSQSPFSVPSNLFILGTMNTADRSVEALDTALRRRFSFVEMPPKSELLRNLGQRITLNLFKNHKELDWDDEKWAAIEEDLKQLVTNVDIYEQHKDNLDKDFYDANFELDNEALNQLFEKYPIPFIDFENILDTLNWRIEKLLNKDYCIGHAHFLKLVDSNQPFTTLKQIFSDNIIPLLQEHFYNDYESIGMVLGEDFIEVVQTNNNKAFGKGFSGKAGHYFEKKVYSFTNSDDWNTSIFTGIYGS